MSVLLYTENWEGKFKKLTFELASYASGVAEMLGTGVTAVSIGSVDDQELKKLGEYGVGKILKADNEATGQFDTGVYAKIIADAADKENAEIIIMANNNAGKAIAPRLSVRLKAGVASAVSELPVSVSPFFIKKRVFSGNAVAGTEIKTEKKIVTLSQNSFDLAEKPADIIIENFDAAAGGPSGNIEVREVERQSGKLLLTDAEIVVSGGRGMKSPDNWGPIEEFAKLLGGATACSRPVSDEGWRPHEEHTGQTGKIIAPNLYFAIGISGATQHLAGISASKVIVAINNDKDAPIFDAAQYGIVGDASKVLPKLVEALKEAKSA